MKKIVLFVTLSVLLSACSNYGGGSYTILGTAKGIKDGAKVILQTQSEDGKSTVAVDTVLVKNEKFEIKGKVDETTIHGLLVESTQGMVSVILEKGTINVAVYKDSVFKSKVSGTFNNDEFGKFNTGIAKLQKSVQQKLAAYEIQNNEVMKTAKETNDTITMNKLRKGYGDIQNQLVNYSVDYSKKNPKAYISLLIVQGLFNNPNYEFEDVKKQFNGLDADLKKLKPAKKIQEMFDSVAATEIGKVAPNFKAKNPKGKEISLDDSKGKKATIVDFWASWCMPCRQENPNMTKLYKDFHEKGLNIIGVSLDNDSKDWITAIAVDQLLWPQVSNLKQWDDPIAKLYNVNTIPATFLLDEDGKIVAKNISGAELRKKVEELMMK